MASVTRLRREGRNGWRVRFYLKKRRREIYLAGVSKKVADAVGHHCDELAGAAAANTKPAPEAIAWANGTDGSLRDSLVAWGLADPISEKLTNDQGRYLGPFLDAYIKSRSDVKATTITNYRQSRRLLVEYFGDRYPIRSITPSDAERWKRWLLAKEIRAKTDDRPAETMAAATVAKHIKRAKTMFADAVADRILSASPFEAVKAGAMTNSQRQQFIDRATIKRVLEKCPSMDWQVVFALSRYGGLRPCEIVSLRWIDVDWDKGRLVIDSPKTGLRSCPIFPELREILTDAHEAAEDGAEYCAGRYRRADGLSAMASKIIRRAGVQPWPKPFNNLRASRRTELQENFPSHVIDSWLGHSTEVAEKHYLMVHDEHWTRAIDSRPPTRPPINDQSDSISSHHETKKPNKTMGLDGLRWLLMATKVTPTGLENAAETNGFSLTEPFVPPPVPPSASIPSDLIELLEVWPSIDATIRDDLLTVARDLSSQPEGIGKDA